MFGIVGSFAGRAAGLAQRLVYEDDELLISIESLLKLHEHDVRRSQSFFGKLTARFYRSVPDPERILIDGMRLHQLYQLADEKPSSELLISGQYRIGVTRLRLLLQQAAEDVERRKPSSPSVIQMSRGR